MGIVNASPDSFSDAGELPDTAAQIARAHALAAAGARIVDVGGETARGGLEPVAIREEIARVVPIVEAVARELDVLVSVDTYKPEVAEAAIAAGARIVNDVSCLRDPRAGGAVRRDRRRAGADAHARPAEGDAARSRPLRRRGGRRPRRARRRDRPRRGGRRPPRAAAARPRPRLRQDAGADGRRAAAPGRPARLRPPAAARRCRARTSSVRSPGAARASAGRRRSPRSDGRPARARTCCGCTTSPRRPTSSPCGPCSTARASSSRTPGSRRSATPTGCCRLPCGGAATLDDVAGRCAQRGRAAIRQTEGAPHDLRP